MWNSRSPGVDGAWWRPPCSLDERVQLGRPRTGEQPVPGVGADRGDHRQALGRVAEADRAHQPRDVGQRVVDGRLAAFVDGGHQEDGRGCQRRQNRLRQWIGHRSTLSAIRRRQMMVNHVRKCAGAVRVHRRVAVAVPRLRDGRGAAAGRGLHRARRGRRLAGGRADFFTVRAGSLVAWRAGGRARPCRSASSAATPTAPTCGSSSIPTGSSSGWQVVALQPYGGAWLNSWLDRDLGISGRLSVRAGRRPSSTGWSASTSRSCGCRSWPSTWPRTARRCRWTRSGTSTRCGASAAARGRSSATSPSRPESTPTTCSAPT